jgi:hypothetical protein
MSKLQTLTLIALACAISGCTATGTAGRRMTSFARSMKPESWDEELPADDPGDPWIAVAGQEGRADQPRVKSDEPKVIHNLLLSPRARAIEQNLGYDSE